MKFVRQNATSDNAVAVVSNLVKQLNLKVTPASISEIKKHPEYPSLACITDSLTNWRINNMAINSTVAQLTEIPFPAIAHLHKNNGHFVVLRKLEAGVMQYIDPEIGETTEPLTEFEKKWSGVVLLVEANEKSGEGNYKDKRKVEVFERVSRHTIQLLVTISLLATLIYINLREIKKMGAPVKYNSTLGLLLL